MSGKKTICFISHELNNEKTTGIHRYTREILKAMDQMVQDGEVELLIPCDEDDRYPFQHIRVVKVGRKQRFSGNFWSNVHSHLYKDWYCRRYVRKKNALCVDLLLLYPYFRCGVTAMHDCVAEWYEKEYPETVNRKRVRRIKSAIRKASVLVTVSESAKEEIRQHYGSDTPIRVIPNAWQHTLQITEDDRVLERFGLRSGEFFFSLGTSVPHKNQKWIQCAARDNPECTFVLTGLGSGEGREDGKEDSGNLIFTGYLTDGEVRSLMKHCKAFIQPSLIEGFGIPPLEAMSAGASCMVSDLPVFREIFEDSVWYFDPKQYDGINLERIMDAQKQSNEKILNKYSWEESARKLLDLLNELAAE